MQCQQQGCNCDAGHTQSMPRTGHKHILVQATAATHMPRHMHTATCYGHDQNTVLHRCHRQEGAQNEPQKVHARKTSISTKRACKGALGVLALFQRATAPIPPGRNRTDVSLPSTKLNNVPCWQKHGRPMHPCDHAMLPCRRSGHQKAQGATPRTARHEAHMYWQRLATQ